MIIPVGDGTEIYLKQPPNKARSQRLSHCQTHGTVSVSAKFWATQIWGESFWATQTHSRWIWVLLGATWTWCNHIQFLRSKNQWYRPNFQSSPSTLRQTAAFQHPHDLQTKNGCIQSSRHMKAGLVASNIFKLWVWEHGSSQHPGYDSGGTG